jgi:pimeloyl-ACP methyl ester carboxylesterase
VRYFARSYRDEVAGVVLVDALNEDSQIIMNGKGTRIRDFAKGIHAPDPQDMVKKALNTSGADQGPVKLDTAIEFPLNKLPPTIQKLQIWAQSQPTYQAASSNEMKWSPEDVADLYANRGNPDYSLGNIPLIVISRGDGGYSGLPDSAALENERQRLQGELAHLSTNSKQIIDRKSGHNIHLEDPATVIDAVMQVIHAYTSKSQL